MKSVIDSLRAVLSPLFELYQTAQDPASGEYEATTPASMPCSTMSASGSFRAWSS